MELILCTDTLLRTIADKRVHRQGVADVYWMALRSSEETDWAKVNAAIIARWSLSALNWIKEQAWKNPK